MGKKARRYGVNNDPFKEYIKESERAFSFTPNDYISIHRKLFTGIYSHAG